MLCEASGGGKERKVTVEEHAEVEEEMMVVATEPDSILFFPSFQIWLSIHLSPTTMATVTRVVKLIPSKTAFLICDIQTKFRAQLVLHRCSSWLSFIRVRHSWVRFDCFHNK